MTYDTFNPSPLEQELVKALSALRPQLEARLSGLKIESVKPLVRPHHHSELVLTLSDSDGDQHMVTMRMIHSPVEDLVAQGFK